MTMTAPASETIDARLVEARARYSASHPRAAEIDLDAREVMPGGNTRTVLYHPPFPIRVASAHGARIVDVDGHEYVDLLGEYTAGLYGHDNAAIRAALEAALARGLSFGAHNADEPRLARALVERFPALELVRFTNSGTEANLMAVSLARAATGRSAIAVAVGGYHGGLLYFGGGGSPVNAPYDVVLLPYNDLEASQAALRASGQTVAAVLIETTMGSAGCIPGSPEYLRGLQGVAHEVGALFIVDEVMTSRLSPSGSSPGLGLEPDLITLGKYLGGGLSFGAFGGRADLMGLFDPTRPTPLQHAGTFNNNVLTMAAGLAGLTHVLTPEAVDALNARGDRLRESLQQVVAPHGWTAIGRGSMVCLHPVTGPVTSPADLASADSGLRELLFLELLERGWYMALRGFMALSLEVSDDDVDGFVSVVGEVLGSWPTSD